MHGTGRLETGLLARSQLLFILFSTSFWFHLLPTALILMHSFFNQIVIGGKDKAFTFDHLFWEDSRQVWPLHSRVYLFLKQCLNLNPLCLPLMIHVVYSPRSTASACTRC